MKILITEDQFKRLIQEKNVTYGDGYNTPFETYTDGIGTGELSMIFCTPIKNEEEYRVSFGKCIITQDDIIIPSDLQNEYEISDGWCKNGKLYIRVDCDFSIYCNSDESDNEIVDDILKNNNYTFLGVHLNPKNYSAEMWTCCDYKINNLEIEDDEPDYYNEDR